MGALVPTNRLPNYIKSGATCCANWKKQDNRGSLPCARYTRLTSVDGASGE